MSEITEHLSGYIGELNNYMDRLNHNTLSRRDRQNFFEMSNEYYDIFQKSMEENKGSINNFPPELLEYMEAFSGSIIDSADDRNCVPSPAAVLVANQYYDMITRRADDYIETIECTELQFEIFQKDAEIIRLQNEKLQMMQRLTDIEMQRDGQLSQLTMEILEVQNSEVVNGRVREIGDWEREIPESGDVTEAQSEPEPQNNVKLKLPYMSKETFLEVKEKIKSMGAKYNPAEKEWYVPAEAGQDIIDNIKSYLDAHDEAIYLRLPLVEKQEFKQMIDQLKNDGARYNPDKKRWYITECTELNYKKFFMYLPLSDKLFRPERESVHDKLNQFKSDSAKNQPAFGNPEYQKRETPERA